MKRQKFPLHICFFFSLSIITRCHDANLHATLRSVPTSLDGLQKYTSFIQTLLPLSLQNYKNTCTVKLCTTLNQRQLKPMLQDYNSIRSYHYQHSRVLNNKLSVWHHTTTLLTRLIDVSMGETGQGNGTQKLCDSRGGRPGHRP